MEKLKLSEPGLLLPEVSVFDSSVNVDSQYTDGLLTIGQVPGILLHNEVSTDGLIQLSAQDSLNENLELDPSASQVQYIIVQRDGQILELQAPVTSSTTTDSNIVVTALQTGTVPSDISSVITPNQTDGVAQDQKLSVEADPTCEITTGVSSNGDQDKLECGLCGHISRSLILFLSHKTSHIGRGRGLGCEICNLSFSRQLSLTEHYRRKHKIDLNAKKSAEIVKGGRQKSDVSKPIKPLILQSTLEKSETVDSAVGCDVDPGRNLGSSNDTCVETAGSIPVTENCSENIGNNNECDLQEIERNTEQRTDDFIDNCQVSDPDEYLIQKSETKFKDGATLTATIVVADERIIDECEASVAQLLKYQQTCDGNNFHTNVSVSAVSLGSAVHSEPVIDTVPMAEPLVQTADSPEFVAQAVGKLADKSEILNSDESTIVEATGNDNLDLGNVQSRHSSELDLVGDVNEVSDMNLADESVEHGEDDEGVSSAVKRRRTNIVQNVIEQNLSEGSEKENANNVNNASNARNDGYVTRNSISGKKMRKLDARKTELAERSSSKLLAELDMPDFHFIASVEETGKRAMKGGKYYFKCLYCEVKMSWRSTICRHMRDKHADILKVGSYLAIPSQITESGERLMKMSEYIQHERSSKKGKRTRGIETQDLPGNFPCEKCGKVFHRLRYLRKHMLNHKTEKNHLCSVCVKTFKTVASLTQHMKSHREREPYKCNQCDFVSTFNIAIHSHRQIHNQGCVLCEICGSAYTDKSTLTKHKQVHDQSRAFACPHPGCTWRFRTKAMCSAHFRAHSSKGKFECRVCNYAFRQKHHLVRHEKTIHGIIPDKLPSYRYMTSDLDNYNHDSVELGANENVTVVETENPCPDEVSMIINGDTNVCVDGVHDQFDLENALQTGHLVIATDDGTINYEMSDLGMTGAYQTLLHDGDGASLDSHTILIPQVGSHVVYQHEEVTETVVTDDHLHEKDTDSS